MTTCQWRRLLDRLDDLQRRVDTLEKRNWQEAHPMRVWGWDIGAKVVYQYGPQGQQHFGHVVATPAGAQTVGDLGPFIYVQFVGHRPGMPSPYGAYPRNLKRVRE